MAKMVDDLLKTDMLKVMLDAGCIVPGPITGKDGFISPSNPSAKIAMNSAEFLQLLPRAVQTLIPDASMIDVVAGIETSGIPVASLVAYALKKPFAYVRKKPKPYGRRLAIQGEIKDKRVLVVDDLIFYGETKDEALKKISEAGGVVAGMFVLVTMNPQSAAWATKHKINLLSLFDRDEIYYQAVRRGMISSALYQFEKTLYNERDWLVWHNNKKLWQEYQRIVKADPLFNK